MKNDQYMHITTPHGARYIVDMATGNITRNLEGRPEFSGQWQVLGFEKIGPFNTLRFVPLSKVPALLKSGEPLRFKNGRPRFTVRDLDHGTTRIWGNWQYHGVGSAYLGGLDE